MKEGRGSLLSITIIDCLKNTARSDTADQMCFLGIVKFVFTHEEVSMRLHLKSYSNKYVQSTENKLFCDWLKHIFASGMHFEKIKHVCFMKHKRT